MAMTWDWLGKGTYTLIQSWPPTINAELAELAETLTAAPLRGVAGTSNRERTIADRADSFVRDSPCHASRPAWQAHRVERMANTFNTDGMMTRSVSAISADSA